MKKIMLMGTAVFAAAAETGAGKVDEAGERVRAVEAAAAAKEKTGPAVGAQGAERTAGSGGKRFTDEEISRMRAMRAEKNEKGGPVYSHAKLAEAFGTNAGTISMIVRNRTYKNPDYTPVNDGN